MLLIAAVGCAAVEPTGPAPADAPKPPAIVQTPPAAGPHRLLKPEDLRGLAWRSIGPANMGGRVADICAAPGDFKTFYVATGTGGLFKTSNRGTTFTPLVLPLRGVASWRLLLCRVLSLVAILRVIACLSAIPSAILSAIPPAVLSAFRVAVLRLTTRSSRPTCRSARAPRPAACR